MILVCGDRKWEDGEAIEAVLRQMTCAWLINGGANGADKMAAAIARKLKMGVVTFEPPWDRLGKVAGPVRNALMLDMRPAIVVGFHDKIEESLGTKDCLNESSRRGYPTFIWTHTDGQIQSYRRIA